MLCVHMSCVHAWTGDSLPAKNRVVRGVQPEQDLFFTAARTDKEVRSWLQLNYYLPATLASARAFFIRLLAVNKCQAGARHNKEAPSWINSAGLAVTLGCSSMLRPDAAATDEQ